MKAFAMVMVVAGLVAAAAPVQAEPVEVVATQPLALAARGLSGSYERQVGDRWSAVALGGVRAAAREDYHSRTATAGLELRLWGTRRPLRGPFVGLHVSGGITTLHDDVMDVDVGSSFGLSQRLDLGWRFTIRRHLVIAPSFGFGAREDISNRGRLATTARPMVALGLEIGWMR